MTRWEFSWICMWLNKTVHFQGSPQAQGVMTRASAGNALHSPGTYQLVMDPRLGLIVGAVTSPQATQGVCVCVCVCVW